MARKVITQLVDDLDGTELDDASGESVNFALDGQAYEIDLGAANARELRDVLRRYIDAGRRIGRATGRTGKRSQSGSTAAEIREWARTNGHDVPDRGRIPQDVRDAFEKR